MLHKKKVNKIQKHFLRGASYHYLPSLKVRKNQKADWPAVGSPKKQMDEFDLFAVKSKKANKTN